MATDTRKIEWWLTARDQASGVMRGAEASMGRLQTAYGKFIALAGVGIGFGGIVAGFKSVVDAAASLDDLSEKTGASVSELSKLSQVASIGGHSMETAETAMVRLTKAIHGADEESKGAGKALAALGLSADALRNKDTAEALRIVAGELNKYADGSGKSALALDLLGKSGTQALPFLKDLANEQGITARVTTEQSAAAEELQKSIGRLKNEFHGFAQSLALEVVPGLNDWIEANREGIRVAGSAGEALRLFVFNLDAMTNEAPRQEIARLTQALLEFQQASSFGKFMQSPTGFLFGGRESDLQKQIDMLKFLERKQALSRAALLGGDTRGEQQRFGLAGAVKPALDYAAAQSKQSKRPDVENPYQSLLTGLQRKLELDDKSSAMDRLMFELATMRGDAYAKLTHEQLINLNALAHEITLKEEKIEREKREIELNKVLLEHTREVTAEQERQDETLSSFNTTVSEHLKQIEFETQLYGMTGATLAEVNARREIATELRKLENEFLKASIGLNEQELKTLTAIYDLQRASLPDALHRRSGAKKLADENEEAASEITEFWKAAAQSMQQSMSDLFFDIMQGKLSDLGTRFKQTIDRMVADQLAAQATTQLFGKDFGKGGNIGGWVGQGLNALGFGGSGITTTASVASMAGVPEVIPLDLFGGFASGGSFMVGGGGGTDSQFVGFNASPNERVTIETPQQQQRMGEGGSTYYIDARNADRAGMARLESMIRKMGGGVDTFRASEGQRAGAMFNAGSRSARRQS